jgi:hypothetical protein
MWDVERIRIEPGALIPSASERLQRKPKYMYVFSLIVHIKSSDGG